MMDLANFLLDRLAEDERVITRCDNTVPATLRYSVRDPEPALALRRYLDTFNTERLLAELAAKRQLIALYRGELERGDYAAVGSGNAGALEEVLRLFARGYAQHPEFRPEWRF